MDERHPRRRRNWSGIVLVTMAVPILAFIGLMLAIGLSMSGSY